MVDVTQWLQDRYPAYRPRARRILARAPIELPQCGRDDLAAWTAVWGCTTGAEIGVDLGAYSARLLEANPALTLLSVDAWLGTGGAHRQAVAQARLAPFGARSVIAWSLSTGHATLVPDESLDFVYIDAHHALPSVIADLAAWEPKVRSGGVVAGHDYFHMRDDRGALPMHVVEATAAWSVSYRRLLCVLGTKSIGEGDVRDKPRSWMWVKA